MDLHPKQFVRVNVTTVQIDGVQRASNRQFSVDPRTITLERLRHLLARAMDIRREFSVHLLRSGVPDGGALELSCDWDLEGALAEEPRIDLALRLHPDEPGLEEWDIICPADVPVAGHEASSQAQPRKGSFLEQVFRPRPLLGESEFRSLCDWPRPLRYAVFRAGGADPALRPFLWMHLLDVFPAAATQPEREEFLNRKAEEYYGLRHSWQRLLANGTIPGVLRDVTCLVRKDVRRTDRLLDLDEHALYNVLTTYAVHHPSVGYCQGMSDLLSPLLHVMKTEARAYVALCGLMQRMRDNFRSDGRSVRTKFRHLRRALRTHDPALHDHLERAGSLDMLFCYRWLLLDLKREFPYHEMLRLTEVMWSTLRPLDSEKGVDLYEVRFPTASVYESMKEKAVDPRDLLTFAEDHFGSPKKTKTKTCLSLKRWAMLSRRQSIAQNIEDSEDSSSADDREGAIHPYRGGRRRQRRKSSRNNPFCRSWSGRDYATDHRPLCYANTVHEIQIDRWLNDSVAAGGRRRHGSGDSNYGSNFSEDEEEPPPSEDEAPPSRGRSEGYTSGQDSHQTLTDHSDSSGEDDFGHSSDSADTYFNDDRRSPLLLPPPNRLGDGKPFLVFLCLTMILNHRDAILSQDMDASETGIYFDRLVRGHRLSDVLPRAKELFAEYLRTGWTCED